jgi:hypothetical protein
MNTVLNLHCLSFYWRGKSLSVGISFGFNIVLELMSSGPCYYLCEVRASLIYRRYNKMVLVPHMLYSVVNLDRATGGRLISDHKTIQMLVCIPEGVFHECEVSLVFTSIN